ncbi:MDR family MFS transporter [Paenibacillus sp. GCM10027626]|uniref:MDR family MFS transporter n=1 Tax=Paenibacillus sp. GCM10027626 TaxID=3273411 RepID=UPI00363F7DF3
MQKPALTGGDSSEETFSLKKIIPPMMAIIAGMIMVILDGTVVNVAVPELVKYFETSLQTIQWTITGYTLALSAVIPLAGWMTDKFGAKRIFVLTIVLFTLGSVLCSLAQTPEQLVLYRIIQGLGGGMVAPIGMAMVFKLAPPERRGSIMGMLGIPMLLAPALGPVLSGYLVQYATWHWIFLINVPVGLVAVWLGLKFLPGGSGQEAVRLDLWGMILAPIAFAMLVYGVSEGSESWTSASTITGLAVGGAALIVFIIVELRQKYPLLELRVFGSTDFTRGILLLWVTQIALFGAMLLIPLYLQNIRGLTPLETGLLLLPQALASGVAMPIGGKLFDKFGAKPLAMAGLTVITAALYMLSGITSDTANGQIILCLIMMGMGMGLSMMPLNTHVLNSAPRQLVSRVTPLTAAAQQIVVSFAIAGLTGYLTSRMTVHAADPEQAGNPLQVAVLSYGDTFLVASCIAVAGLLLTFLLRKPAAKPQAGPEQDAAESSMMMGH